MDLVPLLQLLPKLLSTTHNAADFIQDLSLCSDLPSVERAIKNASKACISAETVVFVVTHLHRPVVPDTGNEDAFSEWADDKEPTFEEMEGAALRWHINHRGIDLPLAYYRSASTYAGLLTKFGFSNVEFIPVRSTGEAIPLQSDLVTEEGKEQGNFNAPDEIPYPFMLIRATKA